MLNLQPFYDSSCVTTHILSKERQFVSECLERGSLVNLLGLYESEACLYTSPIPINLLSLSLALAAIFQCYMNIDDHNPKSTHARETYIFFPPT